MKIKVYVAVDHTGDWYAVGGNHIRDDEDGFGFAVETLETGENRYITETEVEIPKPHIKTVTAKQV